MSTVGGESDQADSAQRRAVDLRVVLREQRLHRVGIGEAFGHADVKVDRVSTAPNAALWRIVMSRLSFDDATQHYLERRTKVDLTKLEAMRCLKRYVAREVFYLLPERVA